MAFNPAAFGPLGAFQARARDLRRLLEESERMEGADEILIAGEKERRAEHDARLHGVRLHHTIVEPLVALGQRFGAGDLPILGIE
jgi:LDH2 family malate/lactate/ureidoglycolate dehydrogenase